MALPVNFDPAAAVRIYNAVRKVEAGDRDQKPLTFERVIEQNPRVFRLGRFSGPWATDTYKTITLEGVSATISVRNLFYPITASVSNKSCAVAKSNGTWLLLSVPFQTATAIGVSGTAIILRITPSDTATAICLTSGATATASVITQLSTGSQSVVTNVQAVLDTATCDIDVTLTTAALTFVSGGTASTITFMTTASTTQIVSIAPTATATAAVVESTQVLSFLRFED
jgi:hypothetical protein